MAAPSRWGNISSGDLENSRGAEKGVSELDSHPPYANHEYMSTMGYISYTLFVVCGK